MSNKAIIDIVSKSLGLYLFVLGLLDIKHWVIYIIGASFSSPDQDHFTYYYLGTFVIAPFVNFSLAWFFIFKSDFISNKLNDNMAERIEIGITRSDLIEVVIIGISMMMILVALPEILTKIGQYVYFNEFTKPEKDLFWNQENRKADILFSILKLGFGLVAITNARPIASRLTRIPE